MKDNTHSIENSFLLRFKKGGLDLRKHTGIMGILNVTPDSFSDGGLYEEPDRAVERAMEMADEGADIIDIGGESSRPGSLPISSDIEKKRILPVIEKLNGSLKIPISVDTYKSDVAKEAIAAGAEMINDISGLRFDPNMKEIAAESHCPIVVMHIKGNPRTMQDEPFYSDLFSEIILYLRNAIDLAESAGISPENIVVDPGIGFGKSYEDNLKLINRLEVFKNLNKPIMAGPSRKSFIGKALDLEVGQRLEGTAAAVAASIINGANIVRVHDVKTMARVARMVDAIKYAS